MQQRATAPAMGSASALGIAPAIAWAPILAVAALKLAVHLATNSGYGIFRDELYFMVCGWRLDWGYVDHPPLVPLLARLGTGLLGASAFGVRLFSTIAGVILVVLGGLLARELGGRRAAQTLAALAVLAAPLYLGSQGKLATDSIEPVFWMGCAYVLARMIRTQNPRLWIWFGLLAGLGLQTKHSMVFFGAAVVAGMLLTPARRLLWSPWLVAGGLAALLVFLPNLIWQVQHGWPTLELLNNVKNSNKNVVLGPGQFLLQQVLFVNPVSLPLWVSGLAWFFFHRQGRAFGVFGWAYLFTFLMLVALKGKAYYLGPIYPVMLAGGAVFLESLTSERLRWARYAFPVLMLAMGAVIAPMILPILSPDTAVAYQERLGLQPPRTERSHTAALTQSLADRFGWEELAANVARVYRSLTAEERARTAIFAQNFGEAGAIDVHGRQYGLPPALSGHQNYYFWGTHGFSGDIVIVVDDEPGTLQQLCTSVQEAGPAMRHPHAMPFERRMNLYVCRGLKTPLQELWPKVKRWL